MKRFKRGVNNNMETKKFIDHHPGSKAVLDIEGRLMFVVDDAK